MGVDLGWGDVDAEDGIASLQEPLDDVGSDEARSTRDKHPHAANLQHAILPPMRQRRISLSLLPVLAVSPCSRRFVGSTASWCMERSGLRRA